MQYVFPIYGFHIAKPIVLGSIVIQPRTTDHQTAETWTRDLSTYHLTAVLFAEGVNDQFLINLEASLAFIERLDIFIGSGLPFDGNEPFSKFEASVKTHRRSDGGGQMIGADTFFPLSREMFLKKILQTLDDETFCESTQFKQLFFKCVEQFRQRRPFVEVSYFLLFSGLETFARSVENDRGKSAASPISRLLIQYGFDISEDRPSDLIRAVSTYSHLRNALFHNGEFIAEVNVNGILIEYRLFKYFYNITQLTNLVVLKAIAFDDGHTNWDSWVDHQPFQ
jgi:hypothetical protein